MAAPKLDRAKAIRILIDAARLGDRKACDLHKITDRTLRNYRARLDGDPKLTEAFRVKNKAEDLTWKAARRSALTKGIQKLEALIDGALPDQIRDVANAVKILGELEITQGVLDGPDTSQPDEGAAEASRSPGAAGSSGTDSGARSVH